MQGGRPGSVVTVTTCEGVTVGENVTVAVGGAELGEGLAVTTDGDAVGDSVAVAVGDGDIGFVGVDVDVHVAVLVGSSVLVAIVGIAVFVIGAACVIVGGAGVGVGGLNGEHPK